MFEQAIKIFHNFHQETSQASIPLPPLPPRPYDVSRGQNRYVTTELYYTLERVLNLFLLDHSVREKADVM